MKCLVADDSTVARRILVRTLREAGADEVIEAANGRQALRRCTPDVDVILADWNMPGMSAAELVRRLRAQPGVAHVPLLLMASRIELDDTAEAEAAGANGCLVKPFTAETLREALDGLLGPGQATGTDG